MLRIRSTYLYLAVALGLFCYIYFLDVKNKSTDEKARVAGQVYSFNADEITHLQITNAGGTVVLEKKDNRWKITKPVDAFPENGVVQQILTELEFLRSERVIPYATLPGQKEETIKQWNLSPPVVKVEFGTDKESHVLEIGRNVALTSTVYARASSSMDAPVYIIRAEMKPIVDRSLADIRSHAVFDFDSSNIVTCSVREFTSGSQVSGEVEADKDKSDNWNLQKPLVARADKKQMDAWLKQLQDLRVNEFVSDENANLSAYGLSSPMAQITVQKQGTTAEEMSLLVGTSPADKPGEVYAKRLRNNSVFTLGKDVVTKLLAGLPECRDKKLLLINAADVTRVEVEQKGQSISAVKKAGVWVLGNDSNAPVEVGRVQDFINLMTTLQATQFVKDSATDLRPYGLDKPQVKVTLDYTAGKETGSADILFGKAADKLIYAKTSTEPFIYSVPSGSLDSLPKDDLAWRSPSVLRINSGKVTEIEINGSGVAIIKLMRESGGSFTTDRPGYSVDAAKAGALASMLCNLRTSQWLGKLLPAYGLDKPVMRVSLTGEGATTVLRVGAALPNGGRAAQIEGQPLAFTLTLSDFNMLGQSPLVVAAPEKPAAAMPAPAQTPAGTDKK